MEIHSHEARPEPLELDREEARPELVNEVPQSSAPLVGSAPRFEAMPETAEASADAAPGLKLDWPSDLVQVETDPQKARVASAYEEAEAAPRVRRVRSASAPMSDEPLVQVETRSHGALTEPTSDSLDQRETAGSVGHV
jgi:hypothetical protein